MTRKPALKTTPAKAGRATPEIHAPSSLLDTITLAPNEDANDLKALYQSLVRELHPRSTVEWLIFRDLVELELERRRLARNLQTAINAQAERLMISAIGRADPGRHPKEAEQIARDWAHGSRDAQARAESELTNSGVLPDVITAEAQIALGDTLAPHVQDRARIEERRRRLLDDFRREARRSKPDAEDAETLDGG